MRKKILKLLRNIEGKDCPNNVWQEFIESDDGNYRTTEYIEFPNYKFIIDSLKEYNFHPNAIKSELRRMEKDGLVYIEIQDGHRYSERLNDLHGIPEMEGDIKTESIILATKGKDKFRYFLFKMIENPIAFISLLLSILAICISYFVI